MKDMRASRTRAADGRQVDRWLIRSGIGLAISSMAFAGVMIAHRDHPLVYGMEYLAIFAQPNRSMRIARPSSTQTAGSAGSRDLVDPTPTGSIAPRDIAVDLREIEIIGVSGDIAWLKSGEKILAVAVGQNIVGLGHVAAISGLDSDWKLLGDDGKDLLAGADAKPASAAPPLGKALIFRNAE